MKTFIAALCAFAVLLGVIIGNCFYVKRTTEYMENALYALPAASEADAPLAALEEYWRVRHTEISFSVSFNEIHALDEHMTQLRAAADKGEDYEFELARALALKAVERIRRLERFSFECIL